MSERNTLATAAPSHGVPAVKAASTNPTEALDRLAEGFAGAVLNAPLAAIEAVSPQVGASISSASNTIRSHVRNLSQGDAAASLYQAKDSAVTSIGNVTSSLINSLPTSLTGRRASVTASESKSATAAGGLDETTKSDAGTTPSTSAKFPLASSLDEVASSRSQSSIARPLPDHHYLPEQTVHSTNALAHRTLHEGVTGKTQTGEFPAVPFPNDSEAYEAKGLLAAQPPSIQDEAHPITTTTNTIPHSATPPIVDSESVTAAATQNYSGSETERSSGRQPVAERSFEPVPNASYTPHFGQREESSYIPTSTPTKTTIVSAHQPSRDVEVGEATDLVGEKDKPQSHTGGGLPPALGGAGATRPSISTQDSLSSTAAQYGGSPTSEQSFSVPEAASSSTPKKKLSSKIGNLLHGRKPSAGIDDA